MQSLTIHEEFEQQLKKYTRAAWDGQLFVLVESLQEWLRTPQGGSTPLHRLLHSAYEGFRKGPLPIPPSVFEPGPHCCLLLFCILKSLGWGHLIDEFSCENNDESIPLRPDNIRNVLKIAQIEDAEFVNKFDELQHRFRPARFDLRRRRNWNEQMVLPIYQRNPIKKGGTASLWQIVVPEEFVEKKLREMCSGSRFNAATNGEPDWSYQFALKSFPYENHSIYENEIEAYLGLQHHEGMIRWLGNYTKAHECTNSRSGPRNASLSNRSGETYNILLEYGEMDMGVYFGTNLPPVRPQEITDFWKSLKGVADAVRGVHNLKVPDFGVTKEYYGWHADIKPDNILQVEDRLRANALSPGTESSQLEKTAVAFKLADPGFATFIKKSPEATADDFRKSLVGGTATYGAPECLNRSVHPVTQAIDIWSLGCVFSLVATWIVYGYEQISIFQQVRQKAVKEHIQEDQVQDQIYRQGHRMPRGDQFHNGHEVLPAVTEWHNYLRKGMRNEDRITPQLLELIDNRMLVVNPEKRIKAEDLCSELDRILKTSIASTEIQLSEQFLRLLGEVDQEESVWAGETRQSQHLVQASSSSGKTITGSRRPFRAERPRVTTHRSSIWPSQKSTSKAGGSLGRQVIHMQTLTERATASVSNPEPPQTPSNHRGRASSGFGHVKLVNRSQRSSSVRKHVSQNYFQALEEQKGREKSSPFKFLNGKGNTSDPVLASYFNERDIVFLVDNGNSMDEHWYQATELLDLLVRKARGLDENGMDLRFTTGKHRVDNKDSASKFREAMRAARPRIHTRQKIHTDLRRPLGSILDDYLFKMKTNRDKDTTVYVFTDGNWDAMDDKDQVAQQIKTFSAEMKARRNSLKLRPFSIQFIQFGRDRDASERLRHLDEDLCEEGIDDFIDTEHSLGDVYKMLLGSFNEKYDTDEGDGYSSASSVHHTSETTKSPESTSDEAVFDSSPIRGNSQRVASDYTQRNAFP